MQVTFPVHTVVFTLEYSDLYDICLDQMLITFAVNSIMAKMITEKYYLFWYILLTMIVHGCRSSSSICNTVVLLNLLYKKIILVSFLLHWSWVNYVSRISLTLSRALLPPHSWAVDVLSIPFFKWRWAAWPTVHTLHFCMSIPSILFSKNCVQCVYAGIGISGSVEHSL